MRGIRAWARLLGLRRAVIEDVCVGEDGEVVVAARPDWRERSVWHLPAPIARV